jgi:hypothetical protein
MPGIKQMVSNSRFEGYRRSPSDPDLECLKRYVWNVALSESLYPSLQFLEIALRNSIHNAATAYFKNDLWFDDPNIVSNYKTQNIIRTAKGELSKAGKPTESGRVVAELSFGFWRALFYNEYENKLWRHIIKDVFPNAPRIQRQRTTLGARIHEAKELRNRTFHYEPIWHWADLQKRHADILETIEWIDSPLKSLADACDNFPNVYNMDIHANEAQLKTLQL